MKAAAGQDYIRHLSGSKYLNILISKELDLNMFSIFTSVCHDITQIEHSNLSHKYTTYGQEPWETRFSPFLMLSICFEISSPVISPHVYLRMPRAVLE